MCSQGFVVLCLRLGFFLCEQRQTTSTFNPFCGTDDLHIIITVFIHFYWHFSARCVVSVLLFWDPVWGFVWNFDFLLRAWRNPTSILQRSFLCGSFSKRRDANSGHVTFGFSVISNQAHARPHSRGDVSDLLYKQLVSLTKVVSTARKKDT